MNLELMPDLRLLEIFEHCDAVTNGFEGNFDMHSGKSLIRMCTITELTHSSMKVYPDLY